MDATQPTDSVYAGVFGNQVRVPQPTESFDVSGRSLSPPCPSLTPKAGRCSPPNGPCWLFVIAPVYNKEQGSRGPLSPTPPHPLPHLLSPPSQEWSENERSRISGILAQRLDKDSLAQRAGPGGAKLVYVESWKQVELANAAFG